MHKKTERKKVPRSSSRAYPSSEMSLVLSLCCVHLFRVCRSRLDATSMHVNFLPTMLCG